MDKDLKDKEELAHWGRRGSIPDSQGSKCQDVEVEKTQCIWGACEWWGILKPTCFSIDYNTEYNR